jgi:hypothetical protein
VLKYAGRAEMKVPKNASIQHGVLSPISWAFDVAGVLPGAHAPGYMLSPTFSALRVVVL